MASLYETQLLSARLRQLALLQTNQELLDKVLTGAHRDIAKMLEENAGSNDIIKNTRLSAIKREIEAIMDDTIDTTRDYMIRDVSQTIDLAVQGRIKAGSIYMYELGLGNFTQNIPKAFATINMDAVMAVLSRTFDDNKTFSNRIWDLRNRSKTVISETVSKSVILGTSARDLAKQIEPYLRGVQQIKGFKDDEEGRKIWQAMRRQRGDLRYQAQRLARTEINNAFREGSIKFAERASWIKGLKWNLSNSHPKPDICDVWASQDIDGLGRGVYKPSNMPTDHPNGFCFYTDILASKEEFFANIKQQTEWIITN